MRYNIDIYCSARFKFYTIKYVEKHRELLSMTENIWTRGQSVTRALIGWYQSDDYNGSKIRK